MFPHPKNNNEKRGQVAVEYLMLVGIALVIIALLSGYAFVTFSQTTSNNSIQTSLKSLAGAINNVYALGEGNSVLVRITLPNGITRAEIGEKYILIESEDLGNKSSSLMEFDSNLSGSLPLAGGVYEIQVKNDNGVVKLNVVG